MNDKLENIIDLSKFKSALVMFGDTRPDSCFKHLELSNKVNVELTIKLINTLVHYGIRPIFGSTEFVFDGCSSNYDEESIENPILIYGKQKLSVENYLRDNIKNHSILRFSKIYGTNLNDGSFISNLVPDILKENETGIASDQFFSAVHVEDVCAALKIFSNEKLNGVFHLGGPERFSRYEYIKNLAVKLIKYKKIQSLDFLREKSIDDFIFLEKRPKDVSLNSSKINKIIDHNFINLDQATDMLIKQIIK